MDQLTFLRKISQLEYQLLLKFPNFDREKDRSLFLYLRKNRLVPAKIFSSLIKLWRIRNKIVNSPPSKTLTIPNEVAKEFKRIDQYFHYE